MLKIMLGTLFVVIAMMATAEGDSETPPAPRLADLPVRESLIGDHPIAGQWEVFLYGKENVAKPLSERAPSNNGWALQRTALAHSYSGENGEHNATALELREDGHQDWQPGAGRFGSSGNRLAIYVSDAERRAHKTYYKTDHGFDPDKAFMLPGRTDRPYSLAADIRWWTDGDLLNINNGRHKLSYRYSVLSADVIRLVSGYDHVFLMVRIGPATQRMQAWNDCVLGNEGRKAWDVEPCDSNPLRVSAPVAEGHSDG